MILTDSVTGAMEEPVAAPRLEVPPRHAEATSYTSEKDHAQPDGDGDDDDVFMQTPLSFLVRRSLAEEICLPTFLYFRYKKGKFPVYYSCLKTEFERTVQNVMLIILLARKKFRSVSHVNKS